MHPRHASISGERAGARSVASRQYVFGSPRCHDDLRQLPSGHSDNGSQRSKVSYLCRHCQPTDNHRAFFETVPAFQPQPNAKIHTLTRRYRRCRRLYPQYQAEIAFAFAVALMRMAEVAAGLGHFRSAHENGHQPSCSSRLKDTNRTHALRQAGAIRSPGRLAPIWRWASFECRGLGFRVTTRCSQPETRYRRKAVPPTGKGSRG
jgi:hypothetical protein